MKKLHITAAFALPVLAFIVGVNSGYALGADHMQCVTYHMLATGDGALVSEGLADDACKAARGWNEGNPTVIVRRAYVSVVEPVQ